MGTAARMERERVDPVLFREHLVNAILIAGTLGIVTFMCCAATITYEVITLRVTLIQSLTDLQRGAFTRADSALWRVDTFLTDFKATNLSLSKGLMQVRVQVKESQEAQTQQAKVLSQAATNVAKENSKAIETVVQAVVEKPPPVVEVKPSAATVEVKTPAPVVERRREEVKPPETPREEPPPKKKRWLRSLWPF